MQDTETPGTDGDPQRRRIVPGAPPGQMIVDSAAPDTVVRRIDYGPDGCDDCVLVDADELTEGPRPGRCLWLDVQGLGDERALRRVAEVFSLHGLLMEDVVGGHQRPKLEDYDDLLFLVTRLPVPGEEHSEQVALVLGRDHVLSFRERPSALFEPVVQRLQRSGSRLRERGSDYMLYALLDVATDAHFPLLEGFEEQLDAAEEQALEGGDRQLFRSLHQLRQRIAAVRRQAVPLRDVVASLGRGTDTLITEQTRVYLRDCHDQSVLVVEELEAARERAAGLMDLALAVSGDRLNQIMSVLTVVASIFIPLTFIAGIYGMNFDTEASPWNMPELRGRYAYPIVMAIMAAIAVAMLLAFRRQGWLGRQRAGLATDIGGGDAS